MPASKSADACTLAIFGASGDLTRRKLIPSLYNLSRANLLPRDLAVVGVASSPLSDDAFRRRATEAIREHCADCSDLEFVSSTQHRFHYVAGGFDDPATYARLAERLEEIDRARGTRANLLFYLATPPQFFGVIARRLGEAKLVGRADDAARWTRLVVEKPFGRDLESARALDAEIRSAFEESQIYRIDHYLGKETVQNVLAFRFLNGIFEPIWNRNYVDHVQITVAETLGVEQRGRYYEGAGALRDIVQNHLFQLLTLVAMEAPSSLEHDEVRNEKVKVLRALRALDERGVLEDTVRGQYGPGTLGGESAPAYRAERDVAPDSAVETFAALKLNVDNWRWADVPFYLRTGKRLAARHTQITIQFRRAPLALVPTDTMRHANRLVIGIQPDERIQLRFQAKRPGPGFELAPVEMAFAYADLGGDSLSTGYETLLHDAMRGDPMLFLRRDMVEEAWRALTPVLDVWQALRPRDFPNYAAGSWGPRAAEELIARDGRHWIAPVGARRGRDRSAAHARVDA
ncbi:MAG: glucose-6-phosphate dehydrogenase [Burkholderiales bacterium]